MPAILSSDQVDELARRFAAAAGNSPKEFQRAKASMVRAGQTEANKAVRAIYNLAQARVAKDLTVKATDAGVVVIGQKRTITFASYGFKPSRKGLRGKILKSGKRSEVKGAFIATSLGGGRVPFFRLGPRKVMTAGRYDGKLRQPIKALHGPSIADALKDTRVLEPLKERIFGRAGAELRRRLLRLGGRR